MPPTMPKRLDPAQDAIRRHVDRILKETGRTRTALGVAVGRDKHWASRWLNGGTEASYTHLRAIERFLGVSLDDLARNDVRPAQARDDQSHSARETWVLATYKLLSRENQDRLRQFLGDLHHDEQHAPPPRKRA